MNRGVALLVTAIVGIGVGFGAAWAMFAESAGAPNTGREETGSEIGTKISELKSGESAAASEPLRVLAPEPAAEASPARPAVNGGSLDAWTSAALIDRSLLAPSGKISGSVTTTEGTPLSGVEVTSSPGPAPNITYHDANEVDLETYLRERAAGYHWHRAARRTTRTDASGRYVLDGLVRAQHRVSASLDGHLLEAKGEWWRAEVGSTVDFVAKPRVELEVQVFEPSGSLADKAEVHWQRGSTSSQIEWTPKADSKLVLEAATYEIWAARGDFRSPSQVLTLAVGETVAPLSFHLAARNGLRGRVIFPADEQVAQAIVSWLKVRGPSVEIPKTQLGDEGQRSWVRPDNPQYEILDVDPGWYAVGIGRDWRDVDTYEILEVSNGVSRHDIELPGLTPERALVVYSRGPDGKPVSDLEFSLEVRSGFGSSSGTRVATRKSDGSYWILLDQEARDVLGGGKTGSVTLRAESPAYGAASTKVAPSPEPSVELVFGPQATLTVGLTGQTDQLVGSLRVRLMPVGAENERALAEEKVSTGSVNVVGPVQPGNYLVVLVSSSGLELDSVGLRLNEGENQTTLEVPPLYTLTVVFAEGQDGRLLLARRGQDVAYNQRRDADGSGRVTFTNVPAGDYTLENHGGGFGVEIMHVRVPTGGEVPFEAQEVNAIAVKVTDPGGVLASAGFQSGDLIVAIGGTELESMPAITAALLGAMSKTEPVRFTVLRGGAHIDLEVDAQKLSQNPGGSLDPTTR